MVAAGVSHGSGPFPVLHVPHVVEATSPAFDRGGVVLVGVPDIEVDTCRKGLPLTRRATRLNDARFDTKCSVHRFPIGTRCTLVLQFLRAEGGLGKGHEPVRIIHGEVERYRIEAGRDMSRRLVSGHGLHHRGRHPRSALQSFGPGARGRAFRRHIATGFVSPVSRFPALAFYGPATFLRTWSSRPSPSTPSFVCRPRSSERYRTASRTIYWTPSWP